MSTGQLVEVLDQEVKTKFQILLYIGKKMGAQVPTCCVHYFLGIKKKRGKMIPYFLYTTRLCAAFLSLQLFLMEKKKKGIFKKAKKNQQNFCKIGYNTYHTTTDSQGEKRQA